MRKIADLFSERDFEKVDFEIEDAKNGVGAHGPASAPTGLSRAPIVAGEPGIPSFLMDRQLASGTVAAREKRSSYLTFTSPAHLAWIVPIIAWLIGIVAKDNLSAFGFFLAPYFAWIVAAVAGSFLRDPFLDGFRSTAAIMQLSAAGFVGLIALHSWSIGNMELVIFLATGLLCLGEIVVSLFIETGKRKGKIAVHERKEPPPFRFDADLPPIRY
jgi:hypothetical protein